MKTMKKMMTAIASAALIIGCAASCSGKPDRNSGEQDAPQAMEIIEEIDTTEFTTTPSGLKYRVINDGEGKKPGATDVVTVHYIGNLTAHKDGKLVKGPKFDSSYDHGQAATFPLDRVIAGWTEGLQLMPVGSTYEFYIPYELAYGEMGNPPVIPPKADLLFTVQLFDVTEQ